ncbi:MAG: 4a-hydroxytetrahydrobiopterin dehydratase [Armatimonadota bacterium]
MALADEKAVRVSADTPPVPQEEADRLMAQIPGWTLKEKSIEREFKFDDFLKAMDFVNKVAQAAQAEDHHPDICISYNKVRLTFSTHKIGGLSMNDFILAARINALM